MIKLLIHDEVNMEVKGLIPSELNRIRDKFSYYVPGHFTMAAFKTGNWSGKESLIDEDGLTFFYLAEPIIDFIENDLGYDLDEDVELIDSREPCDLLDIPFIDDQFLYEETERNLRDHQVNGINAIIENRKGFLEYSTSSGKSLIALGISKAFDPHLKSIVIVPSENLVNQTFDDYKKSDLVCGALTKKVKPKDREQFFEDHDHIILTSKLFLNCLDFVELRQFVLIIDEAHQGGDVIFNAYRDQMRNCPVRVGLTATVPDDKLKRNKLFCHVGGEILDVVTPRQLIDKKYAANISIRMIKTVDPEMESFSEDNPRWEWDLEEKYLGTNENRVSAIADYIDTLDDRNTLVLCHPQMGKNLSQHFNGRMIVDETPVDVRKEWLDEFDQSESGVFLCASYATSGTGLSIDAIHRIILIDVGKNKTYIKQSIGRGMRLSENNDIEVVDISANTKYSRKHRKDRTKIYKQEDFDYIEEDHFIYV